jgi:hypothetical protein
MWSFGCLPVLILQGKVKEASEFLKQDFWKTRAHSSSETPSPEASRAATASVDGANGAQVVLSGYRSLDASSEELAVVMRKAAKSQGESPAKRVRVACCE